MNLKPVISPVVGSSGKPMPGIIAGKTVYLSGVIATEASGKIVGVGDIEQQARQVFANLGAFLEGAGATPSDVVRITIYLTDAGTYAASVAKAQAELLGSHRPASTVLGVVRLANPNALIEVEVTAVLP